MASFDQDYARCYDLLYGDKDYEKEAAYIHDLIQRFAPKAQRILELGCGSGRYTSILARYGYDICGLDLSASMIDIARKKYPQIPFKVANITDFTLDEKFDVIISFFHVMSYQCSNESLCASFANIFKHLKPNGVFLFDCWYGPAVLHEKPSVRIKRVSDGQVSVTRLAEPVLYPDENVVDVHYEIIVNTPNKPTQAFKETHKMRYFFTPEIDLLAKQSGFKLESSEEFLSGKRLNFSCWGGAAHCLRKPK